MKALCDVECPIWIYPCFSNKNMFIVINGICIKYTIINKLCFLWNLENAYFEYMQCTWKWGIHILKWCLLQT